MKPLRVFLDANILFSASFGPGAILTLTEALRLRHEAVTAQLAIDEARRNLASKRPRALAEFEAVLMDVRIVPERDFPRELNLPANDGRLLGTAIAHACTHFLTGDKRHFGEFYGQSVDGVIVISPARLLVHPNLF